LKYCHHQFTKEALSFAPKASSAHKPSGELDISILDCIQPQLKGFRGFHLLPLGEQFDDLKRNQYEHCKYHETSKT